MPCDPFITAVEEGGCCGASAIIARAHLAEHVSENACLFTIIHTSEDQCETIVRDLVAPVATDLRDRPELDCLFYGCFSFPDPQVRFRVLGSSAWVEGPLRQEMERRLGVLEEKGLASGHEFGRYQREVERFGGEEGMRLTERIYHHDSLACLDLIQAEGRGLLGRSRREIAVAMTERILDLLRFDRARRLAFYEFASRWPSSDGGWKEEDQAAIDARYETLKDGLASLASEGEKPGRSEGARDPAVLWGGQEPARIAEGCLSALRPVMDRVLEAHASGTINQDLVYLAWSWTHMHCNRLGISAIPEAILRQLMLRHYRRPGLEQVDQIDQVG